MASVASAESLGYFYCTICSIKILTAKFLRCGNSDYEVIKLEDSQGPSASNSKKSMPYFVLKVLSRSRKHSECQPELQVSLQPDQLQCLHFRLFSHQISSTGSLQTRLTFGTFLQQQGRHVPLTLVTSRLGLRSAHSYSSKAVMCLPPSQSFQTGNWSPQTRFAFGTFLQQQGRHDLPHWLIFSHSYSSKVVICLSHWSPSDSACSRHTPTAARPSSVSHTGHLQTRLAFSTFLQQEGRHGLPHWLIFSHSYSSKVVICLSHWSPPDSACSRHTPTAARPACASHTGHLQTRLAFATLLQ